MVEKQINPILKQVLELGPTLVFFGIYMWIKDDSYSLGGTTYSGFIVAALVFIPILLASIAVLWWLTGQLSRMQIFVAVTVIFFGGLTAWFNNESFFKMKTTIVYGTFDVLLGIGLLRGQSYLQFVMEEFLPMQRAGWMIFTKRLAFIFVVLAVANEIIWRTQSTETWVKLETFAFPVVLFVFLWVQIIGLQKYLIEDPQQSRD